jgi:N-acetylglucosaminyl-diphospho-decaprenol L-rhamnosyltransferase
MSGTVSTSILDVSIVIPAYNRADLLRGCLASVRASENVLLEATVVDNASPEDLSGVRTEFPDMRWLVQWSNVGYAEANNLGLRGFRGRHICLLNSDAELLPDTLAALVQYLDSHPDVGAVTPCNVAPDGTPQRSCWLGHTLSMAWLQDSGFHVLLPGRRPFRTWTEGAFDLTLEQDVPHSQATCLMIRGDAYWQVGEMDSRLFLFYNDVDYCVRLRQAGWRIVYLPDPKVIHHGSASVQTADWSQNQLWRDRHRYCAKWYGFRGTLGVRFALVSRTTADVLRHSLRFRFRSALEVWRRGIVTHWKLRGKPDGES